MNLNEAKKLLEERKQAQVLEGFANLSNTVTVFPLLASAIAHVNPLAPAPITITSTNITLLYILIHISQCHQQHFL